MDPGSSPRVRGRLGGLRGGLGDAGLIPASAGQTTYRVPAGVTVRAHPRECGADWPCVKDAAGRWGSSPRVRGRRDGEGDLLQVAGLIPASAGQTLADPWPRPGWGAHPRECGADTNPRRSTTGRAGSSPRVRGRLETSGLMSPSDGSSPRVRGRLRRRTVALRPSRLIPASAGQTRCANSKQSLARAHPRECGADWAQSNGYTTLDGSSPRVRGRRKRIGRYAMSTGLIPASAGQTKGATNAYTGNRAHPRECGAD